MKPDRIIAVGNDSIVYRDGVRCLKVFLPSYPPSAVFGEAWRQSLVAEAGLPVPPVWEVTATGGRYTIVTPYVRGETLARAWATRPEESGHLLDLFVTLQLRFHTATAPLPSLTRFAREALAMAELSAACRARLSGIVDVSERSGRSGICHGDFAPENVVLTRGGTPGILDLTDAMTGDPAADAAGTYLALSLSGGETIDPERYLAHYVALSGIPEADIRACLPLAAFLRSRRARATERARLSAYYGES